MIKVQKLSLDYWVWAILLVVILLTAGIRVRLMDVPLERDEGEYAYAGQLILQGIPPYSQVYNMKMPGIYAVYALILFIFGQTHRAVHLGLIFINAITILFVFFLTKKLFNDLIGILSAIAFALLSLSLSVQGIFANAEHFVIFFALGGILLILHGLDYEKWLTLLAGSLLLGLAFLMKQHGAAFILFVGLYILFYGFRRKPIVWKSFIIKAAVFLVGVLLPFAATCIILWWSGVFEKFWFWTFTYAWQYVSTIPFLVGLKGLINRLTEIISSTISFWILAVIGVFFLWRNNKIRQHGLFVMGFLFFSFLAICPGFYFRPHYFIFLLPAIALLVGIGAASLLDLFERSTSVIVRRMIPILLALAILFHFFYQQREYLFIMSPLVISRTTYGRNPFPESQEIARFIKENSSMEDTIAVLGSEPQIYFYSKRRSATGYIYTYALMESHPYVYEMQQEMIQEIESAKPLILIYVNISKSWLVRPDSEKMIFMWLQQYQQQYYQKVGIIDIISMEHTVYRWGKECIGYSPRSTHWLSIYQRE